MLRFSRRIPRWATPFLLCVILAQAAAAAPDDPKGGVRHPSIWERVAKFIVHALDEVSVPHG